MAGFDISKYREMFLEEAVELFESADNVLLEAENNGSLTDDEMGQLFRDVHTLKGSGASVELPLFAEFTHDVENMMDKLRNHQIVFIPEMAGTLIDAMDIMKEILELEVAEDITRETFEEMTSEMLVQIRAYINGENVSAQEEVVAVESEPIQEESSAEETSSDFGNEGVSSSSSNSYGIFEDDFNEEESLENDSFGFFSEDMKISNSKEYDYDNENFGFFDDAEDITPASTIKVKVEEVEEKPTQKAQQPAASAPATKAVAPAKAATPAASRPASRNREEKKPAVTNNIRVNLDKIDLLMNNVGDLVITNAMLKQFTSTIEDNKVQNSVYERLEQLERHIRDMQDSIMSIRMVPMESIYSKFPKVVRDISKKLNKKVDFKHFGDNVEIDKAMIEGLTDPLMHIIRNSLDHGIETPEARSASGKNEMGEIIISAEQANGQMIITIEDDGKGIDGDRVAQKALDNGLIDENQFSKMTDNEKAMLVFGAGVSTADQVTDISGRGVGMDVVKTNIHKLGGAINLDTTMGAGTTITIMLPLTLAILDGLDIAVGEQRYILPLNSIVESLQPTHEMIKKIGDGAQDLLMLREEFIPIVKLHSLFGVEPAYHKLEDGMLIVVKQGNTKIAIAIDEFLNQYQVVVKPLDKNFRPVQGIGAATVRGDGSIGLILDVLGIINAQIKKEKEIGIVKAS
ncbi:MAG: chemotaxis protein CheA [Arcobacter sp.]|uniref:chemotaxis protein CheA n=1 Tax=uncultured Arcobacter sp. TaxID=165434 RepID=UPI000CC5EBE9|nr:chemotaxis protein CheA [uncultured Arcobacter sp.]PLY11369.1 MAG: chemotaxis protein CheA [Arcobacter sp.]